MSLPDGWRETTLGEVVNLAQGVAINKKTNHVLCEKSHGLPLLKINNLLNNTVDQYANPSLVPTKTILEKNDVIFTRTGQVGWVFTNKVGILHNNSFKVIPSKLVDKSFLYWFLKQNNIYTYVQKVASGSAQPDLNHDAFKTIIIKYPKDTKEQKAIANILSSFDEKIELLKEQNKTLERMAQSVFKDSLTKYKNSNKTTLGELVKIKYGKDHKHLKDGNYPLYGSGGIMRYVEKSLYSKESILIPRKGTLSNLFFIQEAFWSVDTIFYTEIDENLISPIYLFYKLKRINLANLNVGSAVPSLTTNVLNALELEIPLRQEQEETVQLLSSFNSKVLYNNSQIQTLQKTRDTLLPKLMSSVIRIKYDS